MTDRQHPQNDADPGDSAPDALVALYREATAQDGGPSDAARARVLAYAQRHAPSAAAAGTSAASATQPEIHGDPSQATVRTPPNLPATSHAPVATSAPAANDRRWLRQALGSLAAIGLIGLLTLHHLDEPGAPQLDSPAPASATAPAESAAPPVAANAPASPAAMASNAGVLASAESDFKKNKALPPANQADIAINKEASSDANAASRMRSASPVAANRSAEAEVTTTKKAEARQAAAEKSIAIATAPAVTPAPPQAAAPAPASAPPPAMARAPQLEERSAATGKEAPPRRAPSSGAGMAAAPASIAAAPAPMAEITAADAAAASESPAQADRRARTNAKASAAKPSAKPLPYCDEAMPRDAQSEQIRRIKARDEAKAAGKPMPEPAPVCRPLPKKLTTPEMVPMDSR